MHNKQDSPQVLAKPLISFILTYYNLPLDMLCTCIDSILALSLQGDERQIIVVDDGSDESPVNALMGYGDDITYIRKGKLQFSGSMQDYVEQSRAEGAGENLEEIMLHYEKENFHEKLAQ